ncbi:uncharacterized protein F4822DRAFT_431286 [Hypoxylon trugodes]|uniref:uncharacterized protein n=1 Tax=Hypoxylon trugodes TaxID=326681 RepID=UPI002194CD4B|nr:uncharacterized protein F4822DRAFT_431286 [Hypoxylon trugodes]KAI1386417.1 hypothetical protein F4822DRAFT_431286 [Hypoxylon trugodes]
MQTLIYRTEQSNLPLGHRRGISNLANFALDLSWARAETDCALRSTRAYPSPPMSGSPPPLPPKPNPEVGDRGQGGYQPTSHDAYRPSSTVPGGEYRAAAPPQPSLLPPTTSTTRPFPSEGPERMPYSYHRPEESMGRPIPYQQQGPMVPQPQYPLPPVVGPSLGPSPYSMSSNQQVAENPPFTSPKSQRKTKGHVASACVPCKRAHLRCDAQRPCSRCLSNGKEDSCVDVQHKKRGRPRLRDDNQPRFETGRFPHPADPTMRRPVSLYSPISAVSTSYEDPLRRSHSYRVLKSQPSDPVAPRFLERGSATDANIFPAPLSIPSRAPELVAFLTTDLEIVSASGTFAEAVGSRALHGQRLLDAISPNERDRVMALQRSLQDEQGRKEPNYLPPIFEKQEAERVIRSLSFSRESIGRFQLDRQDFFTFVGADGQFRPYPIRVGLAKEDSIYFVVLLLAPAAQQFPHPSPSPHAREFSYSFQPQPYAQLTTPVSTSFNPGRPRFGEPPRESIYTPRQAPTPITSGLAPGMNPNIPTFSAPGPPRIEPPAGPSRHIPRSELSMARPPQQVEYQLPPIRGQSQSGPPGEASGWQRDDRSGRVDIGGLIEKPDPSRRGR